MKTPTLLAIALFWPSPSGAPGRNRPPPRPRDRRFGARSSATSLGPEVYAFDLSGRDLGAWMVPGATARDWESLTLGPCAPGSTDDCLYAGDTGDNSETRPNRTIDKFAEPKVAGTLPPGWTSASATADKLVFVYPDGPHDDEAIYAARSGAIWLVTKGRTKGFRTYQNLFIYRADAETGEPDQKVGPTKCELAPLNEAQGEGVGWHPNGRLQVLTSEGAAGQISVVACGVPAPPGPPASTPGD